MSKKVGFIECTIYDATRNNASKTFAFVHRVEQGGNKSDRYSTTKEGRKISLIFAASGIKKTAIEGQFNLEDIAPTILYIININYELLIADGKGI